MLERQRSDTHINCCCWFPTTSSKLADTVDVLYLGMFHSPGKLGLLSIFKSISDLRCSSGRNTSTFFTFMCG